MATARMRSSPRCCCTSATSDAAIGHRDLERVVDRRQVAVEHCVEHDALDLDDPPDGTVVSGHAALLHQLSRGARTVPEAPHAASIGAVAMPHPRPATGIEPDVTKSPRASGATARPGPVAGGRRACSLVFQPTTISDGRTTPDWAVGAGGDEFQPASGDAQDGCSGSRGHEAPGAQREAAARRAPARQLGQQAGGHGARRRGAHVQHHRLGERAPLRAVLAAPRGARRARRSSTSLDLAVRGHARSTAEPSRRAAGAGCEGWVPVIVCGEQGEVEIEHGMGASSNQHGRGRRRKSLHAAAESRPGRLDRAARRGGGRRLGGHLRRAGRRVARALARAV